MSCPCNECTCDAETLAASNGAVRTASTRDVDTRLLCYARAADIPISIEHRGVDIPVTMSSLPQRRSLTFCFPFSRRHFYRLTGQAGHDILVCGHRGDGIARCCVLAVTPPLMSCSVHLTQQSRLVKNISHDIRHDKPHLVACRLCPHRCIDCIG